jgi:hypothetical protein
MKVCNSAAHVLQYEISSPSTVCYLPVAPRPTSRVYPLCCTRAYGGCTVGLHEFVLRNLTLNLLLTSFSPLQTSSRPREIGGSFASRRGHAAQLSISDSSKFRHVPSPRVHRFWRRIFRLEQDLEDKAFTVYKWQRRKESAHIARNATKPQNRFFR